MNENIKRQKQTFPNGGKSGKEKGKYSYFLYAFLGVIAGMMIGSIIFFFFAGIDVQS